MASITTWTRLEPRARARDMRGSLEGAWADPAWALARQWHLGAFHGQDTGSLVQATLRADCGRLTRYHPGVPAAGAVAGQRYDADVLPLETLVEREPLLEDGEHDLREAAQAGLHFLRMLDDAGLADQRASYLEAYGIEPPSDEAARALDGETLRLLEVLSGRAPDGARLYRGLRQALAHRRLPAQVVQVATEWLAWYRDVFDPDATGQPPWVPGRMEYEFAVAARMPSDELVLAAPDYVEGHLDWYSFEVLPGAALGAAQDPPPAATELTVIPSPVRFRGMPAARLWEMEDGRINLGAVEAGPTDLARMLLLEFALIYGNDHFVIPMDLPVGSVCRIQSLVVTNTFGEHITIPSSAEADGPDGRWRMFTLSPRPGEPAAAAAERRPTFLLPPALGTSLQGDPVEEVLLLRDEMANMAWAVERVVPAPSGRPLRRFEAYQEQRERAEAEAEASGQAAPAPSGRLAYRLSSEVPDYWYPLLPVLVAQRSIALRLGAIPQPRSLEPAAPKGRVLATGDGLLVQDEQVPRAGARVTRSPQYARWVDGSSHSWIGRRKRPGRGEGSGGLRFDSLRPITQS